LKLKISIDFHHPTIQKSQEEEHHLEIMTVLEISRLTVVRCVLNAGLLDGLLGVAGMMTSYELVMKCGIIPKNSRRKTHQ